MDGYPPSFPPDERALSPPPEGSRTPIAERPDSPWTDSESSSRLARSALRLVESLAPDVPTELALDDRPGAFDSLPFLPNLTVAPPEAARLEHSSYRAGMRIRSRVSFHPSVLRAVEAALDGRVPHVLVGEGDLHAYFAVGDLSDRAWSKVAAFASALADTYGEGIHDILAIQIRDLDAD